MNINYFVRFILIVLLLTLLKSSIAWMIGLPAGVTYFLAELLATGLIVFVLAVYIANSNSRDFKLLLAVFVIYYSIGNINIHTEALVFGVTDRGETISLVLLGIVFGLVDCIVTVALIGGSKGGRDAVDFNERGTVGWISRLAIGAFIYLFIYLAAGLLLVTIYPEIAEFYGENIPPFGVLAITQIFRSLIFGGIAILILRTTTLSLLKKSLLIGLVFSIFGGIAPLIPPNEFMPAYIRIGHGFEVGISNFVYGLILGFLFGQKGATLEATA